MSSQIAPTVSFKQSTYSVDENNGLRAVYPVLVLSNPSSFHITVQVEDRSVTATSKSSVK